MPNPDRATYISCSDLSLSWAKAFTALLAPGVDSLVPLIVNISQFSGGAPPETNNIRAALQSRLKADDRLYSVETTANTIFPENLWFRYRNQGREAFFRRYLDVILPRLKRADDRNQSGTYFERMLSYGSEPVNQLARILDGWDRGLRRRSALQVMLFDPSRDHSDRPYLPFPCLDHVAFARDRAGGLSVTAFYANQYVFDRGYGNYLGLCALGRFVAEELGLQFRQLTCVAGVAQLPTRSISKARARALAREFSHVLPEPVANSTPPAVGEV